MIERIRRNRKHRQKFLSGLWSYKGCDAREIERDRERETERERD